MNADVDAIDRLARRQDAVLSRRQLIELGATPGWMSRRVSSGRWLRLHPGVYLVHTGAVPWRSRARAAPLYAGDGAALSHASAAFHHQLLPERGRSTSAFPRRGASAAGPA